MEEAAASERGRGFAQELWAALESFCLLLTHEKHSVRTRSDRASRDAGEAPWTVHWRAKF